MKVLREADLIQVSGGLSLSGILDFIRGIGHTPDQGKIDWTNPAVQPSQGYGLGDIAGGLVITAIGAAVMGITGIIKRVSK